MNILEMVKRAFDSLLWVLERKYNLYKYGIETTRIHESHIDRWRTSELYLAIFQNDISRVKQLIRSKETDLDSRRFSQFTPLHMAVVLERTQIVDLLVAAKANVHSMNNIGMMPLHLAVLLGNNEIVCSLLNGKANINAKANNDSEYNFDTQHICIFPVKQILISKILIERKGGIYKYHDQTDDTPLHFAATIGYAKIVSTLILNMAKLDEVNQEGKTPLHNAIEYGHIDVAKTLIQAGASFHIADKSGKTAYDLAEEKGFIMTELFPSLIEIDSASAESAKSMKETKETKKDTECATAHSVQPESTENRQKIRLR